MVNKQLRSLRVGAGLTQGQLAKKLGVSNVSVHRWEKGEVLPSPEHIKDMASIFGVSGRDIFLDLIAAKADKEFQFQHLLGVGIKKHRRNGSAGGKEHENMERIFKLRARRAEAAYKKTINRRLAAASDSFGSLCSGPVGNRARIATRNLLRAQKEGRIAAPEN